jgi:hypothetical protein
VITRACIAAVLLVAAAFSFGVLFTGCATVPAPLIEKVNMPFPAARAVVAGAIPNGVRSSSSNGRELVSNYFNPDSPVLRPEPNAKLVGYAVVTILNSTRPYEVEVRAYREYPPSKGQPDSREQFDLEAAKQVSDLIKVALAHRREERKLIDDPLPR